jgi:hypothetical protein
VLTYLRLLNLPIGLLINFGTISYGSLCTQPDAGEYRFICQKLYVSHGVNGVNGKDQNRSTGS